MLLFILAVPTRASYVAASLLSSVSMARPGGTFDVGLRLKLDPGWHVYWRNEGGITRRNRILPRAAFIDRTLIIEHSPPIVGRTTLTALS